MASPLHQFEVTTLIPIHIGKINASFTNSALFMCLAVAVTVGFMMWSMKGRDLVPSRLQSIGELGYEFIAGMLRANIGSEGRPYFAFIFSLFFFILFGNMLGLLPYAFTFTAQLAITFSLAALILIGVTIIGFAKHGLHFLHFFLPGGAPLALAPLMVPLEIISYCFRAVSLGLRLFANMMAGHTLMKVFAGFVVALGVFGFVPMIGIVALYGLEFLVAFLQAYVYTVLACIYLNDALHMH